MEATTAAESATARSTGPKTIADLMGLAASKYADSIAIRHKLDDERRDVTFTEVGEVGARLPEPKAIIVIEPGDAADDATALDEVRQRGRARERSELEERANAVSPDDPFTFIYTSGTTGPPKGCVLTHRNYRSVLNMVSERGLFAEDGELVYLFLPLAHAFALLVQLAAVDRGTAIAYYGGDTKAIIG